MRLDIGCLCPEGECTSALADDDLLHLSLALPQPESLVLGHQCDKSTRKTIFRRGRSPGDTGELGKVSRKHRGSRERVNRAYFDRPDCMDG